MPLQQAGSSLAWLVSLVTCTLSAVGGCADDDAGRFAADGSELAENRIEHSALELSTHDVTLSVNQSLKLTAAYERPDATGSSEVSSRTEWSSANPSIAWVHQGTIVGVYPGVTTIDARYAGASDSVTVTVDADGLRAIEIQPATAEVAQGLTTTLRALGTFTLDAQRDITQLVTWHSRDPSIAELDGNTVLGRARGSVVIEATLADVSGRFNLRVTDARLLELVAVRQRELMEVNATQQLRARGRFSDGETIDVTDLASWSSDDGNLASVDDNGLVRARSTGEVGIWARYLGQAAQTSVLITPLGEAAPQ